MSFEKENKAALELEARQQRMLEEQRNAEETDARAQAESQVEPETEEAEMEIAEEFPDAPEPVGDEEIEVEVRMARSPKRGMRYEAALV